MARAVVCREFGPPSVLGIEEVPDAPLGAHEVRVAVRAAGLNFPDVLMVAGGYQLKPPLPFTPGMEAAGDVIERGGAVTRYRPGDRVIVRMRFGAFASRVTVDEFQLLPLPAGFDHAEGAAYMVAYSTAYHALVDRGRLKAGEVLLVHGAAGGVGLAAVELGKLLGARVIATAGGAEKLAVVAQRGADHMIDYRDGAFREQVKQLTGGAGADVIYDPVGGDVALESLRCINWGGRLLIVGFAGGTIPRIPANYPLLKGCSVIGLRAGEHARCDPAGGSRNVEMLLRLAGESRLRPYISHRLPLSAVVDAMRLLTGRKVIGKAVLTFD